jgi:predicted amidohydrolase
MRLALWQDHSPMGEEKQALAHLGQALQAASAMRAATLVVPEVYLPGYNSPDIPSRAIARAAPVLENVASLCRASGCGIVLGYAERDADILYNSAIAMNAQGQTIAHYRKIQLYGPREKALYAPGSSHSVFDLNGQKAALLICYDIEFSAHVAALAAQGVSLILVPTANMDPFDHVVRFTVPAMAANHGVSIVYANFCGTEGDLTYVGGSLIAGPHGEVLAQAGRTPALLVADIPSKDPARLSTQAADFRAILPAI